MMLKRNQLKLCSAKKGNNTMDSFVGVESETGEIDMNIICFLLKNAHD